MRDLKKTISVAQGLVEADLILKNAHYVNVFTGTMDQGDIAICDGYIAGIGRYDGANTIDIQDKILISGLIDSHIHLESALVLPQEFAKAVVAHGTTAVVTDPHEIANVMGTAGIDLMLEATEGLPIEVHFVLPSCVPSSHYDESGAELRAADLKPYYQNPRVLGLAEMMDYEGLLQKDEDVLEKIQDAMAHQKCIDGHAPFLTQQSLQAYLSVGIGSDHECAHLAEAKEKLRFGQYIMIRHGTAAQNLKTLAPLVTSKTASRCLFCTDDKHPNHLLEEGHVDMMLKQAVSFGVSPILAVQAATLNAAQYFGLKNQGAIAPNYVADLVVLEDLSSFHVETVLKKGQIVYEKGSVVPFAPPKISPHLLAQAKNTVHVAKTTAEDFKTQKKCGVLGMVAGEILTNHCGLASSVDLAEDILKIAMVERHKETGHMGLGFLKGFGLKQGAIATTIAHDSHNLIVVGCSEEEMSFAVNALVEKQGGIVVVNQGKVTAHLPLPVAGIMSDQDLITVNEKLEQAKAEAFAQGVSREHDPFMSLSFLGLTVIPTLRITTKGVFDVVGQELETT